MIRQLNPLQLITHAALLVARPGENQLRVTHRRDGSVRVRLSTSVRIIGPSGELRPD